MWYDQLGIVSIGAQCGGPGDGGLSDIKIDLCRILDRRCTSTFCPAIGHYGIVLRIDGEFASFGPETIGRISRSQRNRDIGVEIVIPQPVWRGKTRNQLRDYLADRVRAALVACVTRLSKDGESVDEPSLFLEIDEAINEFRAMNFDQIEVEWEFELVIRFEGDSLVDLERIAKLENELGAEFTAANIDGHRIGSGQTEIFVLTSDVLTTYFEARLVLQRIGLADQFVAAYRPLDSDEYKVFLPTASG